MILKRILKITLIVLIIIIIAMAGLAFYAFNIEPFNLQVNKIDLSQNQINPLKLVQFSDTHIKPDFTAKNFQKVVDLINQQEADIVVFTGDLYDDAGNYSDNENIINLLQNIKAKYLKIAVYGNHDYFNVNSKTSNKNADSLNYREIMKQGGFILLKQQSEIVQVEGKKLFFAGAEQGYSKAPQEFANPNNKNADYNIFLCHQPFLYEKYKECDYNLILSGHTHGGQINIPFISKILSQEKGSNFFAGLYDLGPNKKLYTNVGIGTTRISARFMAAPEISVFSLPV